MGSPGSQVWLLRQDGLGEQRPRQTTVTPGRHAQGAEQLGEEGAAAVASLVAMARGEGAPGTSAAECRVVTPAFMADVHGVRGRGSGWVHKCVYEVTPVYRGGDKCCAQMSGTVRRRRRWPPHPLC